VRRLRGGCVRRLRGGCVRRLRGGCVRRLRGGCVRRLRDLLQFAPAPLRMHWRIADGAAHTRPLDTHACQRVHVFTLCTTLVHLVSCMRLVSCRRTHIDDGEERRRGVGLGRDRQQHAVRGRATAQHCPEQVRVRVGGAELQHRALRNKDWKVNEEEQRVIASRAVRRELHEHKAVRSWCRAVLCVRCVRTGHTYAWVAGAAGGTLLQGATEIACAKKHHAPERIWAASLERVKRTHADMQTRVSNTVDTHRTHVVQHEAQAQHVVGTQAVLLGEEAVAAVAQAARWANLRG
jgi:hypothetical protein